MDESNKIYDEYLFPNKLRKLAGPSIVKKPGMAYDDFSYLCLAGSIEGGKLMSEHWLLRFNHGRKLKRKYHVNEIGSINSNFSDFSIIVNFESAHSITTKLSNQIKKTAAQETEDEESRQFYFQNLEDVQKFSYELQRSIITCNKRKDTPTQVLGDKLPQNEIKNLNQLRDKIKERGDKIQSTVDTSERLVHNAKSFSSTARLLKEQYSNSIWTSSSSH